LMLFVFVENMPSQEISIFVQIVVESAGAQIFQKSRIHLKGSRRQKGNKKKFHSKGPQILGATVQNFVTWATWRAEILHAFNTVLLVSQMCHLC
jgi:hypothetical protein